MNWIWILVALFLFGCGDGKQKESDGLIRVDVSKSYPKKELILQDLFDIEYVPLETTDEFVTAGRLQDLDDETILVSDGFSSGNIYFTDRQGRYQKKIDRRGQGDEEYIYMGAAILDKTNGELFVNNTPAEKIMVYDLDGHFRRQLNCPPNTFYERVGDFDSEHLICYAVSASDPDKGGFDEGVRNGGFKLVSKRDGSVSHLPTPYETLKSSTIIRETPEGRVYYSIQNTALVPDRGGWLLTEISSDTIYRIAPGQPQEPFIVRVPSIQSMRPEIYLYPGVMTDRYCFLQAVDNRFDFAQRTGFVTTELVYDRQEGEIYQYVVYNADIDEERPINLVCQVIYNHVLVNNNGVAFVSRLYAPDLVEALNDGKLRGPLKEIASRLDEEDNPVILIAKYKR